MDKRVYIAGPMSGFPDHNWGLFQEAEDYINSLEGYVAVNPHKLNPPDNQGNFPDWTTCMKRDIPMLVQCDLVVVFDGWIASRGASLEMYIASELGIPCSNYHVFQKENGG
jgi:hypothetical protein